MFLKDQLKEKLRGIFQFENQDLDFGIYRIMNYKRKEIEKFIKLKLSPLLRGLRPNRLDKRISRKFQHPKLKPSPSPLTRG